MPSARVRWAVDPQRTSLARCHLPDAGPCICDRRSVLPAAAVPPCSRRSRLHVLVLVGVLASPEKTLGPSTCLPVLGIEIDTVAWETRLPPEKVEEYAQVLAAWRLRSSATKRELDSLTGILFYACRVVIPGRPFVRRIVDCGRHACLPCHFIQVTKEARQDIAWWEALLNQWNGRSLFYDLDWAFASDLSLFTDASGRLGFGAVFGSQWFSGEWTQDTVSRSIHWQELFAIYAALLAWGSQWRGKRVMFQCDNAIMKGWFPPSTMGAVLTASPWCSSGTSCAASMTAGWVPNTYLAILTCWLMLCLVCRCKSSDSSALKPHPLQPLSLQSQ